MGKKAMEEGKFVAVPKCYYCGESKGDILLSKGFQDISRLHNTVLDMEPCEKCKEYMRQGVIVVSIRDGEPQEGNPPNPYRTGGWWVLSVEAVNRIFHMDFSDKLLRFLFIEDSAAEKVGLQKGGG